MMLDGLFPHPGRARLETLLGPEGRARLLAEAGEVVAGRFRPFGGRPTPLQLDCGEPLAHWTAYELGRIPLPASGIAPPEDRAAGDPKFLWEPARFAWAYTLGRAYTLTQDETYAEAFWRHTETFLESNPPYRGPQWMNGQEIAIRLLALLWARQVFGAAEGSTDERRSRLAAALEAHAARIPPTLVYARAQDNNHLLVEAAALYAAGRALGRPAWRARGWRVLNRALRRQIGSYGEYVQHSANYHRVMLSVALWVEALREREWPALTRQALGRSVHWLYSQLDPSTGRVPNLGANDGALLLPLSTCPYEDYRPVVQAAARAFLRFQLPSGPWDEAAEWLGLAAHEKSYESQLYLGDHLRGRDSWASLRASAFRSRLGHMDQLHFDLWWRGLNVAQDAGTYLYNAAPPWDNPLVLSRVHNTVTVDGRDQMTRGGRFLTLDWFPAYSKRQIVTDEQVAGRVTAYHRGYPGVRHTRTVTLRADGRWLVADELVAQQPHRYRLHWLLPDWEWRMEADAQSACLWLRSPHGWVAVRVEAPLLAFSLVRAGELVYGQRETRTYEGWASPTYAHRDPALSMLVEAREARTARFSTEFEFPA